MTTRVGLPIDSVNYDRRVVTRSRYITTDPATGRLMEFTAVKVGARRSLTADGKRTDHTGSVLHRIHC